MVLGGFERAENSKLYVKCKLSPVAIHYGSILRNRPFYPLSWRGTGSKTPWRKPSEAGHGSGTELKPIMGRTPRRNLKAVAVAQCETVWFRRGVRRHGIVNNSCKT